MDDAQKMVECHFQKTKICKGVAVLSARYHQGKRVFAENLAGLGFLQSVLLYKTDPNPRKVHFCGKKWPPNATFNLVFLGLGWPWAGEFIGFIIFCLCFPTQQNLVIPHTREKFPFLSFFFFFF